MHAALPILYACTKMQNFSKNFYGLECSAREKREKAEEKATYRGKESESAKVWACAARRCVVCLQRGRWWWKARTKTKMPEREVPPHPSPPSAPTLYIIYVCIDRGSVQAGRW